MLMIEVNPTSSLHILAPFYCFITLFNFTSHIIIAQMRHSTIQAITISNSNNLSQTAKNPTSAAYCKKWVA